MLSGNAERAKAPVALILQHFPTVRTLGSVRGANTRLRCQVLAPRNVSSGHGPPGRALLFVLLCACLTWIALCWPGRALRLQCSELACRSTVPTDRQSLTAVHSISLVAEVLDVLAFGLCAANKRL